MSTEHYDVIVIGSGAGGGTLTYALAPTGKRILLLERGDYLPREPENWSPQANWLTAALPQLGQVDRPERQAVHPEAALLRRREHQVLRRGAVPVPRARLPAIAHVDGISPAWPLSYADLEPYYTRAEHLYHVHGERGVDPTEPPTAAALPLPGAQPRAADRPARAET